MYICMYICRCSDMCLYMLCSSWYLIPFLVPSHLWGPTGHARFDASLENATRVFASAHDTQAGPAVWAFCQSGLPELIRSQSSVLHVITAHVVQSQLNIRENRCSWQASTRKKLSDLCAAGKSGSSALDMFAPTWKTQDFGQIVYFIHHPKIRMALLPVCQWELQRHGLPWPNTGQNKRGCWNSPGCHPSNLFCNMFCDRIPGARECKDFLPLSTVFRMGEMVQRYSQEPWANFLSGFGRCGSGACAVHESLSVCSMCRITGSKCQKTCWIHLPFTVNHELLLEPSLQRVDTLGRIENKNIESSHLIVKSPKVAARYDTGSNQQPNFSTIYC